MANSTTERRKRKYGDKRTTATARNKKARQTRHLARLARFADRAEALVGQSVKAAGVTGHVVEVVYDSDGERRLFRITLPDGSEILRKRRSISPIRRFNS